MGEYSTRDGSSGNRRVTIRAGEINTKTGQTKRCCVQVEGNPKKLVSLWCNNTPLVNTERWRKRIDAREPFPRMKVHAGSSPALSTKTTTD